MSGKSSSFATEELAHLFTGKRTAFADLSTLYFSLHAQDPMLASEQTAHELDYPGYARVAVARGEGSFSARDRLAQNKIIVQFPECGVTGSAYRCKFIGVGMKESGKGMLFWSFKLPSDMVISAGQAPYLKPGDVQAFDRVLE